MFICEGEEAKSRHISREMPAASRSKGVRFKTLADQRGCFQNEGCETIAHKTIDRKTMLCELPNRLLDTNQQLLRFTLIRNG